MQILKLNFNTFQPYLDSQMSFTITVVFSSSLPFDQAGWFRDTCVGCSWATLDFAPQINPLAVHERITVGEGLIPNLGMKYKAIKTVSLAGCNFVKIRCILRANFFLFVFKISLVRFWGKIHISLFLRFVGFSVNKKIGEKLLVLVGFFLYLSSIQILDSKFGSRIPWPKMAQKNKQTNKQTNKRGTEI